jgi:hypothetical protein
MEAKPPPLRLEDYPEDEADDFRIKRDKLYDKEIRRIPRTDEEKTAIYQLRLDRLWERAEEASVGTNFSTEKLFKAYGGWIKIPAGHGHEDFWEILTPEQRLELNKMCVRHKIPLSGDKVVIRRNMLNGEIEDVDDTREEAAFGGGGRKAKRRKSKRRKSKRRKSKKKTKRRRRR